jgi:hypothetical protein
MSKKFLFALMGFIAIFLVGVFWLVRGISDVGLWALWFGGIAGVLAIYTGGNVVQKDVISKNYRAELDDKNIRVD